MVPHRTLDGEAVNVLPDLWRVLQVFLQHIAHLLSQFDVVHRLLVLLHGEHLKGYGVQEFLWVNKSPQEETLAIVHVRE